MRNMVLSLVTLTFSFSGYSVEQGVCENGSQYIGTAFREGEVCWYGTDGDDTISIRSADNQVIVNGEAVGTYFPKLTNYFFGGDGNDQLSGSTGDDRLYGEAGDDTLRGSAGSDWLTGGDGDDKLYGDNGQIGRASCRERV